MSRGVWTTFMFDAWEGSVQQWTLYRIMVCLRTVCVELTWNVKKWNRRWLSYISWSTYKFKPKISIYGNSYHEAYHNLKVKQYKKEESKSSDSKPYEINLKDQSRYRLNINSKVFNRKQYNYVKFNNSRNLGILTGRCLCTVILW